MKSVIILFICVFGITGCKYDRVKQAERAKSEMIGMSKSQLYQCAGVPTRSTVLDGIEYLTYRADSAFVDKYGGATYYCDATFAVQNNLIIHVNYAGRTGSLVAKDSECAYVVQNCLHGQQQNLSTSEEMKVFDFWNLLIHHQGDYAKSCAIGAVIIYEGDTVSMLSFHPDGGYYYKGKFYGRDAFIEEDKKSNEERKPFLKTDTFQIEINDKYFNINNGLIIGNRNELFHEMKNEKNIGGTVQWKNPDNIIRKGYVLLGGFSDAVNYCKKFK